MTDAKTGIIDVNVCIVDTISTLIGVFYANISLIDSNGYIVDEKLHI